MIWRKKTLNTAKSGLVCTTRAGLSKKLAYEADFHGSWKTDALEQINSFAMSSTATLCDNHRY